MNIYKVRIGSGELQTVGYIDEMTKDGILENKSGLYQFFMATKFDQFGYITDSNLIRAVLATDSLSTDFEILETVESSLNIEKLTIHYAIFPTAKAAFELVYHIESPLKTLTRNVSISFMRAIIEENYSKNMFESAIKDDLRKQQEVVLALDKNFELEFVECDFMVPKQPTTTISPEETPACFE